MARIRTIKPEFPQSETVGKLSRDARLLFVQLWTVVDDLGRARGAHRLLAGQLYPYDDDAPTLIGGWLAELESAGLVRLYKIEDKEYLDLPTWAKHQRIDNAGKSHIPPHPAEVLREPPRAAANDGEPPLDLGPRTIGPERENAREPLVSREAFDLVEDIAKSQQSDIESPEFAGFPMMVQSWLNEKIPRDFILATCARLPGKHQKYLDKAVRNSWDERQSQPSRPQNGKAKSNSLTDAIDQHIQNFGRDGGSGEVREASPRLLSHG